MIYIELSQGKKIYFASDNHLGAPTYEQSRVREQHFVHWLNSIKTDAQAIFLLGDLFDFWFEYDRVVPKGFVRTLGKIAELTDSGIPVYFFVGNHDLWMRDYFSKELNIPVFHSPQVVECNEKRFLIGHGDGLGPGDIGYKRMKRVFTCGVSKWIFKWLHPDIGVRLAQYLSTKNKLISGKEDVFFLGEDNEWLVQYCKEQLQETHYDYFLFGHRHLPLSIDLEGQSKYINTGDWITYYTYAYFDGKDVTLVEYEDK